MRILDQAIEEKLYIRSDKVLRNGTWERFESNIKHKRLFLFGAGEGADYIFHKYGDVIKIAGAYDNDDRKWDKCINEFVSYPVGDEVKVLAPEFIKDISDDSVVLITSIRYCDPIYEQLKDLGVDCVFSLLHREANRRQREGYECESNTEDEKLLFARRCLSLPISPLKIVLARDGLAGHGKQIFLKLMKNRHDLDLVWITEQNEPEPIPGIRMISQSDWNTQ